MQQHYKLQIFVSIFLLLVVERAYRLDAKSTSRPSASDETSAEQSNDGKFIKDPFIFYKWPGFGQAEGVYGRWPWYPAFFINVNKEGTDSQEDDDVHQEELDQKDDDAEDDQNEESDEQEDDIHSLDHNNDDYYHHHDDHHHEPWRKQKPTAVTSLGFSPGSYEDMRPTWYGVLNAKVRSDFVGFEDDGEYK